MLRHLARFLQVGAVGFAIDGGLLWVLIYNFEMSPIGARVFSFMVTIAVTFLLNARYTFDVAIVESSMSRYGLVQMSGAVINFASYSGLVLYTGLVAMPLVALVVGSALAAMHNFLMMRRFVFFAASDKHRS